VAGEAVSAHADCRTWEDVPYAKHWPGWSLGGHLSQRFDIVARPIPAAFIGQTWAFRSLDTAKTRAGRGRTVHVLASTRTGVAAAEKKKRHLRRTVFVTSTDCAYSAWVVLQAGAGGSQGGVTSRSWRQASWPKRIIRRGSKRRFEGAPDVQLSMSTVETRLKGLSSFNSWYFSNAGSKVVVDVQ
jgi:hypothetical protein